MPIKCLDNAARRIAARPKAKCNRLNYLWFSCETAFLMTTHPAPIEQQVLALVERYGSPEEKRLISTHGQSICDFLSHPDSRRLTRMGLLDIGLENRLVLKFNLMASSGFSPLGLIHEWAENHPAMLDAAEAVFRHKLRCHAGIKVSATGVEYEIYPYETPEGLLAKSIFAPWSPQNSELPAPVLCFGRSSTGALSAYAEIKGVDPGELEQALGMTLGTAGLNSTALFNSRLTSDGRWKADKAGIEFVPCPSHLLNSILGRFHLNFAYLLHRGGMRRYIVIGLFGSKQILYTTLLPVPNHPK